MTQLTLGEEKVGADESDTIKRLVEMNLKTLWKQNGVTKRGQHGKHHGCVEGEFHIEKGLPKHLAKGLFAKPGSFNCRIRFSNGRRMDDRKKDAHGMAIKLLDVPGTKLLPGQGHITEHDFLLVDHPIFFCATLADYMAFNKNFTRVLDFLVNPKTPKKLWGALVGGLTLRLFHFGLLRNAKRFGSQIADSPLGVDYHSTTPYLLGEGQAVKYKAVSKQKFSVPVKDVDGLKIALWETLKNSSAEFDFYIVLQRDPQKNPVENATIDWEKNGAEPVRLGTIELPKQQPDKQNDNLCERLVFSPWMSLAEHRPLGVINRARRQVYLTMSELRTELNSGTLSRSPVNGANVGV